MTSDEFREALARNRCTEHDKLMPHWGCEQSAVFADACGLDPDRYRTAWIWHPYNDAKALYPGCAETSTGGMQCGWPRGAHQS